MQHNLPIFANQPDKSTRHIILIIACGIKKNLGNGFFERLKYNWAVGVCIYLWRYVFRDIDLMHMSIYANLKYAMD